MATVSCEILLVSRVDVITNPQLRHNVKLRVDWPKINKDPETSDQGGSVAWLTAEAVPYAGLPALAIWPFRLDLDRNSIGIFAITCEHVDSWHVARERNGISTSAVYLGGHKQLPGASHLLVSQLHWSRSSLIARK